MQAAVVAAIAVGTLAVAIQTLRLRGEKWGLLVDDPSAQFGFPVYAGAFTHAGVALLVGTGAIALFAAGLADRSRQRILTLVGLLSLLLAIDDLFLLHERVLREALGVSELVIFAVYGAIATYIAILIGRDLLGWRYVGLMLSVAFLCLMTAADKLEKVIGTPAWLLLLEEAAKLCGFALWAAFWALYAHGAAGNRTPRRI